MRKHSPPHNPANFADALTEDWYAQKPSRQKKLERERQHRITWLRKKFKKSERAQALAERLDRCRPKRRCKSAACPECSYAAQRLFVKITRRYLKGKSGVQCITIVPADGTANPGSL